tara:strand:- start:3156 stop:4634 length:1479 start_codon:yes stop_codon:yes gene_type:complete
MRIFGLWTILAALSISVVAAYYSIVGLVAIFAAAAIPIIIMGTVLEVGKLTSAVWLHLYWNRAPFLMKSYLTVAVILLMFITSMGIFGFLSKAHIEQQSAGAENVAQLERIVTDIARNESIIARAESKIQKLDSADEAEDDGIQAKIDKEQQRISTAYDAVKPAIEDQEAIIFAQKQNRLDAQKPYQSEIANIDRKISLLDEYIENNEIKKAQSMIGSNPDGVYGPKTAKAVQDFREAQLVRRDVVLQTLNELTTSVDTITVNARAEIQRLRGVAEQQIQNSNELIDRLRLELGKGATIDNTEEILKQRNLIVVANDQLDNLFEKKYTIEAEARVLEAEVGPVKYIAELVYGDTDKNTLEEAVRWVIIILVVVFDPLAVVLVIAGITLVEGNRKTLPKLPTPPQPTKKPEPEVEPKEEEHQEQEVIVELEELETIEEFDNIEGAVRYKGRIYHPEDENYNTVIAQVKENAHAKKVMEQDMLNKNKEDERNDK